MLLGSNVIIYAARPEHEALRRHIAKRVPAVLVVSYVDILGYQSLAEPDRGFFVDFFIAAPVLQFRSIPSIKRSAYASKEASAWVTH